MFSLAAILSSTCLIPAQENQRLPKPPVPAENPITKSKAVLGKALFWDEQLSSDNSMACGTCHRPGVGGADPRFRRHPGRDGQLLTSDDVLGSPGVRRMDSQRRPIEDAIFGSRTQVTARTSPSFFTAQYADKLFWDGRAPDEFRDPLTGSVRIPKGGALESQALMPILNTAEMAHEGRTWAEVTDKLHDAKPLALATDLPTDLRRHVRRHKTYPRMFKAAFGDEAITPSRIAFAIASYERTLVPDQTPFDRFLAGDRRAMSRTQRRGFDDFKRARCNECHTPPLFSDNQFRNIGVRPSGDDQGRRQHTKRLRDTGKFKVPSLRNVGLRKRFMHSGEFRALEDVIAFYRRPRGSRHLDPLLRRGLAIGGRTGTIAHFLRTALTDPRVEKERHPFDRPTLQSERTAKTR